MLYGHRHRASPEQKFKIISLFSALYSLFLLCVISTHTELVHSTSIATNVFMINHVIIAHCKVYIQNIIEP